MRMLPRSARGTWLLSTAAWVSGCAWVWWIMPAPPLAAWSVGPDDGLFAVLPDQRGAVVALETGEMNFLGPMHILDARSGKTKAVLVSQDLLDTDAVSLDGRWVVVRPFRDTSRPLSVVDTTTGRRIPVDLANPGDSIFSPDGRWLGFTDRVGTANRFRLWDVTGCRPGPSLPDAGGRMVFSPDSRRIAGPVTVDPLPLKTLHVWDTGTGESAGIIRADEGVQFGWGFHFVADGTALIVREFRDGAPNCRLSCRDIATGRERWGFQSWGGESIAGGLLYCSIEMVNEFTREVTTLDMANGRPLSRIRVVGMPVMPFARNGRVFAINGYPTPPIGVIARWLHDRLPFLKDSVRELRLVDASSGRTMAVISGGREAMWAPDGLSLAVIGDDSVCRLWNIPPRKPLTWFALAATVIALPLAWLAWRRSLLLRREVA